jgi:endonuclease YncB( thermonuclease family)
MNHKQTFSAFNFLSLHPHLYIGTASDRYGRILGDVFTPDGQSLNQELVRAGYAWWFRRYSKDIVLAQLEEEARIAKRGLWADPHAVPPWEWRKNCRHIFDKQL